MQITNIHEYITERMKEKGISLYTARPYSKIISMGYQGQQLPVGSFGEVNTSPVVDYASKTYESFHNKYLYLTSLQTDINFADMESLVIFNFNQAGGYGDFKVRSTNGAFQTFSMLQETNYVEHTGQVIFENNLGLLGDFKVAMLRGLLVTPLSKCNCKNFSCKVCNL